MEISLLSAQQYHDLLTGINEIKAAISDFKNNPDDPILDVPEVCRKLGISKRKFQELRDTNQIDFYQSGHKIWVRMSSIDKFLNKHYVPAFKK